MINGGTSFVDDFEWAVVRLVTFQGSRKQPGRLVVATISLLAPGRIPPPPMSGYEHEDVKPTTGVLHFRRTVLRAKDAVQWYRELSVNPKTPRPFREEDIEPKLDGIRIEAGMLVDDPVWPQLGIPIRDGMFGSLSESRHPAFIGDESPRMHRRFGNAEGFESLLSAKNALNFISDRLHIQLEEFTEYFGTVSLIVPNPFIERVENFLIPSTGTKPERFFYRIVPRSGCTLEGMKISLFDETAHLMSAFEQLNVPLNGIIDDSKTSYVGSCGYIITHPVHGILSYRPPASFLRTMNMNMEIVQHRRAVRVPLGESPKAKEIEFHVDRIEGEMRRTIGDLPIGADANTRVRTAAAQRGRVAIARRLDQRWFSDGTREEATAFIRERVSRARERIVVADPYFGALQIPQYLLAITSDRVRIKILTSRLAFEGNACADSDSIVDDAVAATELTRDRIASFAVNLIKLKEAGNPDVEALVLRGKKPALHDRFLIVDDEVWFVGGSLNALGDRASMIIKLPDPDSVILQLQKMLGDAVQFENIYKSFLPLA